VVETLREPDFERTIPLLALRGRMVIMAGARHGHLPCGPFYVKDCSCTGSQCSTRAPGTAAAANAINRC